MSEEVEAPQEKRLYEDIDGYFKFTTDQGHKYWQYFQVVVAAVVVFVLSEVVKALAGKTVPATQLSNLSAFLAFAVAAFAIANRFLLLGNQAATCDAWLVLKEREGGDDKDLPPLLRHLKPLSVSDVWVAHAALTWAAIIALLFASWTIADQTALHNWAGVPAIVGAIASEAVHFTIRKHYATRD